MEEKTWYESRSIWTAVVSGISTLLTVFFGQDVGLTAEQQIAIVGGIATIASVVAVILRKKTTTVIAPKQ